jgi:Right handed beta helix region
MKIIASFAVGLALAGVLSSAPAQAQSVRTFVSPTGSDSAACSLTAPCRTFAAAYSLTTAGGEIAVLGTAGYGTLTISKAISIVNGGGFEAAIAVPSSGIGITINAGPSDAVSLRGLTIDGAGVGQTGIQFNTGASLTVENCVVRHLRYGIDFSPNASSKLSVSNSVLADSYDGIIAEPSGSSAVTIVLNRVEANNNSNNGIEVDGFQSTGTVTATVSDSIATGGNVGISVATTTSNASTTMTMVRSVSANNASGVGVSGPGATLRLANSTVTGNLSHGWSVGSSGVLSSYGDNYIDGNGSNAGSLTPIARQ